MWNLRLIDIFIFFFQNWSFLERFAATGIGLSPVRLRVWHS